MKFQLCSKGIPSARIPAVESMRRMAIEISYEEMHKMCPDLRAWSSTKTVNPGIPLDEDRFVKFRRSHFEGKPCCFLYWACNDYIWF